MFLMSTEHVQVHQQSYFMAKDYFMAKEDKGSISQGHL